MFEVDDWHLDETRGYAAGDDNFTRTKAGDPRSSKFGDGLSLKVAIGQSIIIMRIHKDPWGSLTLIARGVMDGLDKAGSVDGSPLVFVLPPQAVIIITIMDSAKIGKRLSFILVSCVFFFQFVDF